MPGNYTYGLYPFAWDTSAKCHTPPSGSACVLDFRPVAEQSKKAQSGGYGLFAWEASPPSDLISLGTGYAPTLAISSAARTELRTKLALSADPSGATLADALSDVLGSLSDPTGFSGPKPIMPGSDGTLELHLDGHSRIWSQAVDVAELLSVNPRGRASRIRDVIRADLDEAERSGGVDLLGKALGAKLMSLGFSREEVRSGASGKATQWQRLLSASVKAKHGANAKPKDPQTSFSELWPNATADLSGTAQSLTWSELATDGFADGLKVASNTCRATSAGSNRLGICGSTVSSANHYVEASITIVDPANGTAFVTARQHASRGTFYGAGFWRASTSRRLYKCVTGTLTQLAAASVATPSGVIVRCDVNGSTVTNKWPSLSDQTVTDTTVTGNLAGGVFMYLDAPVETYAQIGAWTFDDGLSAAIVGDANSTVSELQHALQAQHIPYVGRLRQ